MGTHEKDMLRLEKELCRMRGLGKVEYTVILVIIGLTLGIVVPDISTKVEDLFFQVVSQILLAA